MLNKNGTRELAYVAEIKSIDPIEGSDNCESASIDGWHVMVRKGIHHVGDKCVYFEVDSKLDTTKECFAFLEKCHGKIKTQKYTFGGKGLFYSQGLIMTLQDCGLDENKYNVGDFLTEILEVKYADEEDNKRKEVKEYNNTFKKIKKWKVIRRIMRYEWGRKLIFKLFGVKKKKTEKTTFPKKFPTIHPTDQERIENIVQVLTDKTPFIVTQKCDGTSATYIVERLKHNKYEFYVCSRNVRQLDKNQPTYMPTNVYWEMAEKYDIKNKLIDWLKKHPNEPYICWQGEICGASIQKNPHKLKETHFFAFHMIDQYGKWDMREAKKVWDEYKIETVPIIDDNYILPNDLEEFKQSADGYYDKSVCEGKENCKREGFVYYKTTDPNFSFKNVSREYLVKK